MALLRMNLFAHRDLHTWLDDPFGQQPDPADDALVPMVFA